MILSLILIVGGLGFFVKAYFDRRYPGKENYQSWHDILHEECNDTDSIATDVATHEVLVPDDERFMHPELLTAEEFALLDELIVIEDFNLDNQRKLRDYLTQSVDVENWTNYQALMVLYQTRLNGMIDPDLLTNPNEFDALGDDIEIQRREIERTNYPGDEDDKDFDIAGKSVDGTDYDNWNHTDAEDYEEDEYTKYYSDR